jgi:hypothetical protein
MFELLFYISYFPVTFFAIYIIEKEVKHNTFVGSVWSKVTLLERVVACMIPLYREFILIILYIKNRKPNWFPRPL